MVAQNYTMRNKLYLLSKHNHIFIYVSTFLLLTANKKKKKMSFLVLEHRWKLVYISPLKKAKRKNTDTIELEIGVSHLLINKQVVS